MTDVTPPPVSQPPAVTPAAAATQKAELKRLEADLKAVMADALQVVRSSPQLGQGKRSLYRVPWMLAVADARAGLPQLLAAAAAFAPFPPPARPQGAPPRPWDWWFFRDMVVIATTPEFLAEAEPGPTLRRAALGLIARHRPDRPLDAIAAVVSAELAASPAEAEAARRTGLRLRSVIDETSRQLRMRLPLTVIFDRLEALPGFARFVGALPSEVRAQAFGHRFDWQGNGGEVGDADVLRALLDLRDRLYGVRLTLLKDATQQPVRRDVFQCVEAIAGLEEGIAGILHSLSDSNAFQRTAPLRGLYLAAADPPAFVGDLALRFLPVDARLARREKAGGWLRLRRKRAA
ncbi:MAG: type VI secretion protein IcmF/TssM N-terminal domain-containing protein [Alphaproteobacteria bacterium]